MSGNPIILCVSYIYIMSKHLCDTTILYNNTIKAFVCAFNVINGYDIMCLYISGLVVYLFIFFLSVAQRRQTIL